jgi:hypothetical protein
VSKWNYQGHVIGPPECGKTYLARSLVDQHLRSGSDAWAFVHDPVGDQYAASCAWYRDVAAYRAAAADAIQQRRPLPRGAAIGGESPEAVIALVAEVAKRSRARLRILVVIDESSLMVESGSSWISRELSALMAMRRHVGVGPLFLQQRVGMLDPRFYLLATDVYIFQLGNPKGLTVLEENLNLRPGTLTRVVPSLPEHKHVHARNGKGLV